MTNIVDLLKADYKNSQIEYMSVTDYLDLCRRDPDAYATAAERMVKAIGEPERLDTSADPRMSRIFLNRTLRVYPAFKDFYGMEDTIERIVGYFKHAAQGLEEKKQILYLLGPVGGGKCHQAGTQIAMADGTWKAIENIAVGDQVVSVDETTHLSSTRTVTNTFDLGEKDCWEISTARGFKVNAATTHRFFTNHGWKRVDELSPGDLIATAMKLPFGDQRDNPAFLKVLGYLLGDGHLPQAANLTFTNFNDQIVEDFCGAVCELGCQPQPQLNKETGFAEYYRIKEGPAGLPIRNRLSELGLLGTLSHIKFIPDFVFSLQQDQVALLLSRLYATDGWATFGPRCEIGFSTASPRMADQVVKLLAKFGIVGRLHIKPTYLNGVRKRDAHVVVINDRYHAMTFLAQIGIYGKEAACDAVFTSIIDQRRHSGGRDILPKNLVIEATEQLLASKKDGTSKLKNELRTKLDNNIGSRRGFVRYAVELFQNADALRMLADGEIYWDKVDEVRDLEQLAAMYDIEVEGLHNYVANGIVSHNSSISERLKELMEKNPIYVLCYDRQDKPSNEPEMSPVFETPLGLFAHPRYRDLMKDYGIDARYLNLVLSPWAIKRLKQVGNDISRFCVARVYPSKLEQIAVVKTEPGDDNNQDISTLVGKTDIRMLEKYSQNDPDAYSFSGALCRGNQGLVEFVEMFKAPIKMLHPLLTATQEGNYMGTEAVSAIPFHGLIVAHSNLAEWQTFKTNKNNEAFIDRVCVIKVPYCLRFSDERLIYEKMLENSELAHAPCSPGTLEMLAQFSVLTRLKEHENSTYWSKMCVYDGKNVKETDPRAKSVQEYRDAAGVDEGMDGTSTRFAFKVLSATFNHDPDEVSADPVHLMYSLEKALRREQLPAEVEKRYLEYIKADLAPRFVEFIGNEIQTAYLEAYDEYGQTLFDRTVMLADHWCDDLDYKDPDTGVMYDREYLNAELEKIEKPAGIANPKDFRHEIVKFVLRQRANGKFVKWTSYEKLRKVIEKKMFSNTDDLIPIISFGTKASSEDQKKHDDFVARMVAKGYTPKMCKRVVEWYMRVRKTS